VEVCAANAAHRHPHPDLAWLRLGEHPLDQAERTPSQGARGVDLPGAHPSIVARRESAVSRVAE
jgi:hypothetical protein